MFETKLFLPFPSCFRLSTCLRVASLDILELGFNLLSNTRGKLFNEIAPEDFHFPLPQFFAFLPSD